MAISIQEAILQLPSVKTTDELTRLLCEIDPGPGGGTTILYSGGLINSSSASGANITAADLARQIASETKGITIIDNTPIGPFMNTDRESDTANKELIAKLDELFLGDRAKITAYLYGSRDANGIRSANGLWDRLSANFVARAQGAVITFTGGARRDGVFAQVELPGLLANPAITSIDGIPIGELRRLSPAQAFDLVTATSDLRAAALHIPVDSRGQPLAIKDAINIDSRSFFDDRPDIQPSGVSSSQAYRPMADFIPPERLQQHRDNLRNLHRTLAEQSPEGNQSLPIGERLEFARLLSRVDDGLAITDLALTALEAYKAYEQGDQRAAQQILYDWALENAGAIVAGRLAGLLLAPLIAAGPLGLLLGSGLTIGASVLGSSAAKPAMNSLIEGLARLTESTITTLQTLFRLAENTVSPLVLDLDGNGVSTRSIIGSGVNFDHNGNGFAERSGWVGSGDGLLVRDLNGDGRITSGNELFGNATRLSNGLLAHHGFEALSNLDDNRDGQVDNRDRGWDQLRIWVDADADAMTDGEELLLPEQVGVRSLLTAYRDSSLVDAQGNSHRQLGSYLRSDGTQRELNDVWFQVDPTRSRFLNPVPVPAAIAALPDLPGLGNVASLHQVMAIQPDSALVDMIRQWQGASSALRKKLIEAIVLNWTGVQNAQPSYQGDEVGAFRRKMALEKLIGRSFGNSASFVSFGNSGSSGTTALPAGYSLAALERCFTEFCRDIDLRLSAQCDLPALFELLTWETGNDNILQYDTRQALAMLRVQHGRVPDGGNLLRLARGLQLMGPDGSAILQSLLTDCASQSDSVAVLLRAAAELPVLQTGGGLRDWIYGTSGNDWLEGQDGNDELNGWAGRDVLAGGRGNDTLNGSEGSDLYLIGSGEGEDTISEYDITTGNCDEIHFMGLSPDDVRVERLGRDLVLIGTGGVRVVVLNHFGGEWARIEKVSFAENISLDASDLRNRAFIGGATEGNDNLGGYTDMVCRISALGGNDTLTGGLFNDLLDGGSGNDDILAGAGNDTLIAGGGNDTLNGGDGNDTYLLSGSPWRSLISNYDATIGRRDEVIFTDLSSSQLTAAERLGNDLHLRFSTGSSLQVSSYFSNAVWQINAFRFQDGVSWGHNQLIERLIIAGATNGNDVFAGYDAMPNRVDALDGNDLVRGHHFDDILRGGAGNDSIQGLNGHDLLDGGSGNDDILAGAGNDTLIAGGGNDTLNGGDGNDTYLLSGSPWRSLISNYDATIGRRDEVIFTDLSSSQLTAAERLGNDLHLRFATGSSLQVSSYFSNAVWQINAFRFQDGVSWGHNQLIERLIIAGATNGNDVFAGYDSMPNRVDALDGNDLVRGHHFDDILRGGAGNDSIQGLNGHDLLDGGSGNDDILAGAGNDTLIAGGGNDTLNGGDGNDTYILSGSPWRSLISNYDATIGRRDEVIFTDLSSSQLTAAERLGNDLHLRFSTGSSLQVSSYFSNAVWQINAFRFQDGVSWGHNQLIERLIIAGATNGNDVFAGYDSMPNRVDALDGNDIVRGHHFDDILRGGAGNDSIQGLNGHDLLDGGSGNDDILAGAGNDTLIAGGGNDTLNGGDGNDTYLLSGSPWRSLISNYDATIGRRDEVIFTDLSSSQLSTVERLGNDLNLRFSTGSSLQVSSYFSNAVWQINAFRFQDGVSWGHNQLIERLQLIS